MGVPDGMRTSPGVRKTQFPTGGHWELLEKPIWASPGAAGPSGASRSWNRFLPTSPLFGSFLRAPCSVYLHLWHALGILLSFCFKKFWGFLDSVLHVDFRAQKNRKIEKIEKSRFGRFGRFSWFFRSHTRFWSWEVTLPVPNSVANTSAGISNRSSTPRTAR